MAVDVTTSTEIACPPDVVAAYAADPDHVTAWYANITRVEWLTAPPLGVGSRLAFTARFLSRELSCTDEVVELEPGRRLVMRTEQGPFPMETTYEWTGDGQGGTRMTLRNRGEPTGWSSVAAPVMAGAVRRATTKDLARLRSLLEGRTRPPD